MNVREMSKFGDWLLQVRKRGNLSQEKVAERAGLSKNYISIIERDKRHPVSGSLPLPSRETVISLAHAVNQPEHIALQMAGYAHEEIEASQSDEHTLLTYFRELDEKERRAIMAVAESFKKYKENADE